MQLYELSQDYSGGPKAPHVPAHLPENQLSSDDWDRLDALTTVERSDRTLLAPYRFSARHLTDDWDPLAFEGSLLLSDRARAVLAMPGVDFLPCTVNDRTFHYMVICRRVTGLDFDRSGVVFFDGTERVWMIENPVVFHPGSIPDPAISYPVESSVRWLCTASVKAMVESAQLRGFRFIDASTEPERVDTSRPIDATLTPGSVGCSAPRDERARTPRVMTEEQLDTLEQRIGRALPRIYREFMKHYPEDLVTTKADYGWEQVAPAERDFTTDVNELIRLNEGVLSDPLLWAVQGDPWPQAFVVIGANEGGDLYAIDTEDTGGAVYFYDHETGDLETVCDSLDAFRSSLLRDIEDFDNS